MTNRISVNRPPGALIGSFLLLVLVAACNTLPVGEDGIGRIPRTDSLIILPDSGTGIARHAVLGAADTMILGRDGNYVSRVLISFALPDSALDSITRAELILHPADSTRMRFVCHPCSVEWSAGAATWRVADSATQWLNPGGDYYSEEACRGVLAGDSLVIELGLGILPRLIREAYGIILLPLDTGFVRLSSGFTIAGAPRIRLYWGAERKETRTINATEDAHIIDTIGIGAGPGYRAVGSGFSFRTWLRFNLDSIPPEATVARADLRFLPPIEYRRGDTIELGVRRLLEPLDARGGNPRFVDAPSARLRYIVGPDSVPIAAIDMHRLVQYWTANPDSNFGLFLVAEPEWTSLFRLRVPVSGPSSPRLDVLYALPPPGRFW